MQPEREIERVQSEHPGTRVDCYVLFSSHTDAMQLFGESRSAGIGARISTTPRQARSSCGVALLVACDDARAIERLARERSVPFERIVALPNQINPGRDVYC